MKRPRRNHSAAFKAKVALEALRSEKTLAELAAHHDVVVSEYSNDTGGAYYTQQR